MKAKEYLEQAYHLDKQINNKLEIIHSLHDLATKTTNVPRDMPGSPNRNVDKMESAIVKMVDLGREIDADVDRLVDLKVQIIQAINKVSDVECRILLEKRYLLFTTWVDIAVELNCSVRNVHFLHKRALQLFQVP